MSKGGKERLGADEDFLFDELLRVTAWRWHVW